MPELAEVEIVRRALSDRLVGQGNVRLVIRDDRLLKVGVLGGAAPIRQVRRRAKYLVFEHGQDCWVLHLRMTGRISRQEEPGVRAVFTPEHTEPVFFVDRRCLGELHVMPRAAEDAWFARRKLGEEPWPSVRPVAWWQARLGGLRSPIKTALMRQDRVAGLGNIAASEILWRARVAPQRLARDVEPTEWMAISEATVVHLDGLLAVENAETAYVTQGGENPFRVYGRRGERCPECGTGVCRAVQAGRASFWCPSCQPR